MSLDDRLKTINSLLTKVRRANSQRTTTINSQTPCQRHYLCIDVQIARRSCESHVYTIPIMTCLMRRSQCTYRTVIACQVQPINQ